MKKRMLSALLALTLCLGLLPAALAEGIPLYGWESQVPKDPGAITYDMEVADFGTMKYGYKKEDCPTLTVSFTNTSDQTLWYIHTGYNKGGDRFESSVTREGWDSVQRFVVGPIPTYALELKPGSSASVDLTLCTGYRESTSFPAGVYDGELDFFFATSDEPVGSNQYTPIFKGGNYPLPYHFEIVYDGYMGGEEAMELDRESVDFGVVEKGEVITETVSVTNRAQVEMTLEARLADRSLYHGDWERTLHQRLSLKEKNWTLAPGETVQIQIVKDDLRKDNVQTLGKYDTELMLTSYYQVEGGGNIMSYRDEKVVPISLTVVEEGNLSVWVELESPWGPSGYFTSNDGTTYWGNNGIDVPYGGDLSLNIVPFNSEHGYVLAVERYSSFSKSRRYYVGHDDTLLTQEVTDGQRYRVTIASCAVPPADWARDAVGRAYTLGIFHPSDMPGRRGGNHGPDGDIPDSSYAAPITRKDFCNLARELYQELRPEEYRELPESLPTSFTDTDNIDVRRLAYLGVISGVGDEKFDPDGELTREQAATILSRLAGVLGINLGKAAPTFDDNGSIAPWASEAVGQMQSAGIMGGVGNNQFGPQGTYSWEQSIATLMRIYDMTL